MIHDNELHTDPMNLIAILVKETLCLLFNPL